MDPNCGITASQLVDAESECFLMESGSFEKCFNYLPDFHVKGKVLRRGHHNKFKLCMDD